MTTPSKAEVALLNVLAWRTRSDGETAILTFAGCCFRKEVSQDMWDTFMAAIRAKVHEIGDINIINDAWRLLILLAITFTPGSGEEEWSFELLGMVIARIWTLSEGSKLPAEYTVASVALVNTIGMCVGEIENAGQTLEMISNDPTTFPEMTRLAASQLW